MACSLSGQVMSSSSIRAFLRLFMERSPFTSPTVSISPSACRIASRFPVTTVEGRASPEKPVRVTEKTSVAGMSSRSRQKRPTGTSPNLSRTAGGCSLSRASASVRARWASSSRSPEVASATTGAFSSLASHRAGACSVGSRPPIMTTSPSRDLKRRTRASSAREPRNPFSSGGSAG